MNPTRRILRVLFRARILACAFLFLFGAGSARAQLISCAGAAQGPGLKVLLDEIYYTSATPPAAGSTVSMDRLQFRILTQLEKIVEEMEMRPDVVPCAGRKPRGANDFNEAQVDQLNGQGVVLEVWGSVDSSTAAAGSPAEVARVGYALIPTRFYEHFRKSPPKVQGVHLAEYSSPSGSAASVLEQSSELQAFTALGIGMKALKANGDYDQARKYFCKAELLLRAELLRRERDNLAVSAEYKALLENARDWAGETVRLARADAAYRGALRLIPAEEIASGCPDPGGTP